MHEKYSQDTLPQEYDFSSQRPIRPLPINEIFISQESSECTTFDFYSPDMKNPERFIDDFSHLIEIKNINEYNTEFSYADLIQKNTFKQFQNLTKLPELDYERKISRTVIKNFIQTPQFLQGLSLIQAAPLFNSVNVQQAKYNYPDIGSTKPEDLPEMALPILEFIEDVQPHIVIGCDRGGRLFGVAMHAAWQHTREGQPFPTLDGKLHFARVSKSEDADVLQEKIDEIVEVSKRIGKQRGNELAKDEQLRVLFVDDWVIGGGTMRLAQRLMRKHKAQTYFAVMCGEGADVTGKQDLHTSVSWHDRPEEIGVNYLSSVKLNTDGTITQMQEVVAVRAIQAVRNRQKIQEAAQQLAPVRVLEAVA